MHMIYKSQLGRWIMTILQKTGASYLANRFLKACMGWQRFRYEWVKR